LGIPGAVVRVSSPQGDWSGASGFANLETRTPLQPEQSFFIGSISKTFTAVAVLKLVEQGKLSLDDPLAQWLPEIADQLPEGDTITLRQLLNGTDGLFDGTEILIPLISEDPTLLLTGNLKPSDLIAYAYGQPRFSGSSCLPTWCYPNTGYAIAGLILEKATGSSYAEVIRQQVLHPLGLQQTLATSSGSDLPANLARGYLDLEGTGTLTDITLYDQGFIRIAGGSGELISTAADVMQFAQGLSRGTFLEPQSFKELMTFVETGSDLEFGLGLERQLTPWGQLIGKTGGSLAYQSWMIDLADQDIKIVILVNAGTFDDSEFWPNQILPELMEVLSPSHN
jgi:D-alanyl-D-alanine carboxypeptidase